MNRIDEQWAASRETSESLAEAMYEITTNPDRLWENGFPKTPYGKRRERELIRRARELDEPGATLYWGATSCAPGENTFS
jgi:hypothetical protein